MRRRQNRPYLPNVLVGAAAVLCGAARGPAHFAPDRGATGPVLTAAVAFASGKPAASNGSNASEAARGG